MAQGSCRKRFDHAGCTRFWGTAGAAGHSRSSWEVITQPWNPPVPCLKPWEKKLFHAGASGAGQVAKIANNMLLAIHMIGTAEALTLGVQNGLDPAVLSEIMINSSGRNWSLELYNPTRA